MSRRRARRAVYAALLDRAQPGARLVYWNMLAPRGCPNSKSPGSPDDRGCRWALHRRDRAWFYTAPARRRSAARGGSRDRCRSDRRAAARGHRGGGEIARACRWRRPTSPCSLIAELWTRIARSSRGVDAQARPRRRRRDRALVLPWVFRSHWTVLALGAARSSDCGSPASSDCSRASTASSGSRAASSTSRSPST